MKKIASLLLSSVLVFNVAFAQKEKDVALETIGAASGLLLYNTYLAIGTVSDAYAGQCYKADVTTQLAQEQINTAELLANQYNLLLESGFLTDKDDKAFVTEIVLTFGYLKNEATYLKAFVESGSDKDTKKYEDNRNEAWTRISKMLGLNEEK